jgi:tol-pal system protein YbgF
VEELQFRTQSGSGASGEIGEILADKVAEIDTRLLALEQRIDPQLSATLPSAPADRPGLSSESPARPGSSEGAIPAPATEAPVRAVEPSARTLPTTRPPTNRAEPSTGRSEVTAERLYERAKQEYDAKNYEVAAVLFKQFLRDHSESPLAGNSQYWLGETFYSQRQYEASIVAFDEVIQKYGDNAKVPASILKQGYAFAALDDSRNARFFLEQVQRKFPDSAEARQAEAKLKTLGK